MSRTRLSRTCPQPTRASRWAFFWCICLIAGYIQIPFINPYLSVKTPPLFHLTYLIYHISYGIYQRRIFSADDRKSRSGPRKTQQASFATIVHAT